MPGEERAAGEREGERAFSPKGSLSEALPRRGRLCAPALFQDTYAQGRKYVGRAMVLWVRSGEGAALRLGVVSSRRVGPAVDRVRARRRLREAYRRHRNLFEGAFDVVLVARGPAISAPWDELVSELLRLARRAGLVKRTPTTGGI